MTFFFVYVSSLLGERKPPGDEYNDFDEGLGRPSLSPSRSGEGGMGVGEVEVLRSARKADGYPLQLLWGLIDWITSGSFLVDDNDVLLEYLDQCSSHVGFSFFRFFRLPFRLVSSASESGVRGLGKGGSCCGAEAVSRFLFASGAMHALGLVVQRKAGRSSSFLAR
jgi:hypothetical protein